MRLIDAEKLKKYCLDGYMDLKPLFKDPAVPKAVTESFCKDIDEQPTINQWIPISERLPENNVAVNITWRNTNPDPYYKHIKDKPFTSTARYYKGQWYWESCRLEEYLEEYDCFELDLIDEVIKEVIKIDAWQPLPEPYSEGE